MVVYPYQRPGLIRIQEADGRIHVTVMPRITWSSFVVPMLWCLLIGLLVLRPILKPLASTLVAFPIVGWLLLLVLLVPVAIILYFLNRTREHGTIDLDSTGIRIDLRGLWSRWRREFPKDSVRAVRAVCGSLNYPSGRGRGTEPLLMLRIMPWEGQALELLRGYDGRELTALAEAATSTLGISSDHRRQEWLKRQLETGTASAQSTVLAYSVEARGTTLEVTSQRVVLSLPPHGPIGKAAQFTISEGAISCVGGDIARGWGLDQVHWVGSVDNGVGFGAMAVVLEDGEVVKLFTMRPTPELQYAARVLNSALGLTVDEKI